MVQDIKGVLSNLFWIFSKNLVFGEWYDSRIDCSSGWRTFVNRKDSTSSLRLWERSTRSSLLQVVPVCWLAHPNRPSRKLLSSSFLWWNCRMEMIVQYMQEEHNRKVETTIVVLLYHEDYDSTQFFPYYAIPEFRCLFVVFDISLRFAA